MKKIPELISGIFHIHLFHHEHLAVEFETCGLKFGGKHGAQARGSELTGGSAISIRACLLELVYVGQGDDLRFHARHLRDMRDLARPIGETGQIHDQVNCRGNLLAYGDDR